MFGVGAFADFIALLATALMTMTVLVGTIASVTFAKDAGWQGSVRMLFAYLGPTAGVALVWALFWVVLQLKPEPEIQGIEIPRQSEIYP